MAKRSSPLADNRHLFIVAGYPTTGKSSALWKSARTGFPLFGEENGGVVPATDSLGGVGETSGTSAKLAARFWLTLNDLPFLNRLPSLPDRLILHLDLLLAAMRYRTYGGQIAVAEMEALFARLFAEPALHSYQRCTVLTLHAPIEEVQRRWRHRHPAGVASTGNRILTAKDRLIMHERIAAPLFATIHAGWARHLETIERGGLLVGRRWARSTVPE